MSGIYNIFLLVPSVDSVLTKVAKIWQVHNNSGQASIGKIEEKRAKLIVRQFPETPKNIRRFLSGYYQGVLELTKAKNVIVELDETDPNAWAWVISWS